MSDILQVVKNRDPEENEFHQAVSEVMESVKPVLDQNPITFFTGTTGSTGTTEFVTQQ